MRIADLFVRLMTELGYSRFAAHGGDWGSRITEAVAFARPEALARVHLTKVPYWHLFAPQPKDLSEDEQKYLKAGRGFVMAKGAYSLIKGTKPQTLAYGPSDSPAGLAGWFVKKFRAWSDCGGDVEARFSKDELLTNLKLYWATNTVNSANRLYYEARGGAQKDPLARDTYGLRAFPQRHLARASQVCRALFRRAALGRAAARRSLRGL